MPPSNLAKLAENLGQKIEEQDRARPSKTEQDRARAMVENLGKLANQVKQLAL